MAAITIEDNGCQSMRLDDLTRAGSGPRSGGPIPQSVGPPTFLKDHQNKLHCVHTQ